MTLWQLVSNVLSVVFLDLALGGDNAAVIAMAAKNLDVHLRKKAIFFGAMGAVGCRFILAAIAVELMQIPYLKLVGALILFYIGAKLIGEQEDEETPDIKSKNTLMGAIVTIIAADAIMSLDNVLAIVGATNGHLGMVVFGMLFSVPIILFGSTIIVKNLWTDSLLWCIWQVCLSAGLPVVWWYPMPHCHCPHPGNCRWKSVVLSW